MIGAACIGTQAPAPSITFKGTNSATRAGSGAANTWSVPSTASNSYVAQNGDLIILASNVWAGSATFDGAAAGFTFISGSYPNDLWYKVSAGSEPTNWGFPVSNDFLNAVAWAVYGGVSPSSPFLNSVTSSNISSSWASGSLTASGGEFCVLAVATERQIGVPSPAMTARAQGNIPPLANGIDTRIFDTTITSSGSKSFTGTMGGGGAYDTFLAFLRPA